jgi:hypothetical protein
MQAKLLPDYRFESITACGGLHFNKETWRDVPVDQESDATNNPYLELRERPVEPVPEPAASEPEGQGAASEVAPTTPQPELTTVQNDETAAAADAEPELTSAEAPLEPAAPAAESDAALEAEAVADDQAAVAAEQVAGEERQAAAKKRAAKKAAK